jgi:hypothetical protein
VNGLESGYFYIVDIVSPYLHYFQLYVRDNSSYIILQSKSFHGLKQRWTVYCIHGMYWLKYQRISQSWPYTLYHCHGPCAPRGTLSVLCVCLCRVHKCAELDGEHCCIACMHVDVLWQESWLWTSRLEISDMPFVWASVAQFTGTLGPTGSLYRHLLLLIPLDLLWIYWEKKLPSWVCYEN